MTELTINIASEKEQLIKLLIEELGGEIIEEKRGRNLAKIKQKAQKNTKEKKGTPSFLFGQWKDHEIDPRKLREETWGRKF